MSEEGTGGSGGRVVKVRSQAPDGPLKFFRAQEDGEFHWQHKASELTLCGLVRTPAEDAGSGGGPLCPVCEALLA